MTNSIQSEITRKYFLCEVERAVDRNIDDYVTHAAYAGFRFGDYDEALINIINMHHRSLNYYSYGRYLQTNRSQKP